MSNGEWGRGAGADPWGTRRSAPGDVPSTHYRSVGAHSALVCGRVGRVLVRGPGLRGVLDTPAHTADRLSALTFCFTAFSFTDMLTDVCAISCSTGPAAGPLSHSRCRVWVTMACARLPVGDGVCCQAHRAADPGLRVGGLASAQRWPASRRTRRIFIIERD